MLSLITPQSLKDLVDANAIQQATVVADNDVFKITIKYGAVERIVSVRTREGQVKERVFTSLDAVARFMREKVHLAQFEVNAANFKPLAKRAKRPDTSLRLKEAHAALSRSEWLQHKVQAARAGLADGSNKRIAPADWERVRAEKKAQRDTR
jgi:hypothetical protein